MFKNILNASNYLKIKTFDVASAANIKAIMNAIEWKIISTLYFQGIVSKMDKWKQTDADVIAR